MADLTFIQSLSDEQAAYALKVAQKAEEMGIPKTLALGIVMNESGFNPKVPDSKAGAIGLMQVMPATGKSLGYSVDQLRNEDANIEAGLKALKENLDRTKGDWLLSAALYNAGDKSLSNTNVAQKGIPAETANYVQKLQSYGVFNTAPEDGQNAEEAPAPDAAPAEAQEPETSPNVYSQIEAAQARNAGEQKIITEAQDRAKAQIGGAGVGAAISASRMAPAAVRASSRMMEEGRLAAQAEADARRLANAQGAAGNVAGTTGRAAVPTGAAGPLSTAVEGNGLRPPGRGAGLFNYGIDAGLTDIEAARALDMTKQEGGAHNLLTKRRIAMNRVGDIAPNQFVENPRFGGLMTPTGGGGGGARESMRFTPEGTVRMPVAAPIPTIPPKPGGLEYVTDLFKGLMDSKIARGAGTVMRYAGPPAAMAEIAGEGMNLYQQSQKPEDQRDYGDMALSGLGVLAGGVGLAATSPAWVIPAGLTAAGIAGYRYMKDREAAEQARQRMSGQPMR
jgi:soluble lytic murein transglycosylase-like protein